MCRKRGLSTLNDFRALFLHSTTSFLRDMRERERREGEREGEREWEREGGVGDGETRTTKTP